MVSRKSSKKKKIKSKKLLKKLCRLHKQKKKALKDALKDPTEVIIKQEVDDDEERNDSELMQDRVPKNGEVVHSPEEDHDYSANIRYFTKVREKYFLYLQKVIGDNCHKLYKSNVSKDVVESLSLDIEQYALLSCMQTDVYRKSMNKIFCDIKKCTGKNQLHDEVKKILTNKHGMHDLKDPAQSDETSVVQQSTETFSYIPTITNSSCTYSNANNLGNNHEVPVPDWSEAYSECNQSNLAVDTSQTSFHYQQSYGSDAVKDVQLPDYDPVQSSALIQINSNNTEHNGNLEPNLTNGDNNHEIGVISCNGDISDRSQHEHSQIDPILLSRNQLQKSVEETLNIWRDNNQQKKDEKERAEIAQILEGDDSLDDDIHETADMESLSDRNDDDDDDDDEENNSFSNRIEKMRQIFGVDDEENCPPIIQESCQKSKESQKKKQRKKVTVWKYEKNIHMYKLSMLLSQMSEDVQIRNKITFLKLFGDDSDEEHEEENRCEKKYLVSCTERISAWVVKYLMPYYHQNRISGRSVFKKLGHHISESVIEKNQYPDEFTVKCYVSKFFSGHKIYLSESDVLRTQLE